MEVVVMEIWALQFKIQQEEKRVENGLAILLRAEARENTPKPHLERLLNSLVSMEQRLNRLRQELLEAVERSRCEVTKSA